MFPFGLSPGQSCFSSFLLRCDNRMTATFHPNCHRRQNLSPRLPHPHPPSTPEHWHNTHPPPLPFMLSLPVYGPTLSFKLFTKSASLSSAQTFMWMDKLSLGQVVVAIELFLQFKPCTTSHEKRTFTQLVVFHVDELTLTRLIKPYPT